MSEPIELDKNIAALVDITDALLKGEFDQSIAEDFHAEGMLSTLAQKINAMVVNMKTVKMPLTSARSHAPDVVASAENVVQLTKQSTSEVLDKADKLMTLVNQMEAELPNPRQETLTSIKETIFDIVASQSFQDVARQRMNVLIKDLNKMRDWLVETLVVLNIQKDASPENLQQKAELLKEVNAPSNTDKKKQDLVDDLLAEFGF